MASPSRTKLDLSIGPGPNEVIEVELQKSMSILGILASIPISIGVGIYFCHLHQDAIYRILEASVFTSMIFSEMIFPAIFIFGWLYYKSIRFIDTTEETYLHALVESTLNKGAFETEDLHQGKLEFGSAGRINDDGSIDVQFEEI